MKDGLSLETFLTPIQSRYAHQPKFLQAVREVFTSLVPFLRDNPQYCEQALLQRIVEPERWLRF